MRLLFAGTPETALPSLRALLESRHEVAAVLTRPDAARGRGRRLAPSPVAAAAQQAGIETLKPATPRDPAWLAGLRELAPDCCPIVAYGGLIPTPALQVPPGGWVNLHFSLLPAWRGAAPVQRALIAGDDVTGATTFSLVQELDAGPTYGCCTETIRPDDTAGSVLDRLAEHGAELLVATLDGIEDGTLKPQPQPAAGVSVAPKLSVEEAKVDWSRPAYVIDRLVRGCTPTPGSWTPIGGDRLKLRPVKLRPHNDLDTNASSPGQVCITRTEVLVGTGTHPVALGEVQPPGKPWMPAADWARGLRGAVPTLGR